MGGYFATPEDKLAFTKVHCATQDFAMSLLAAPTIMKVGLWGGTPGDKDIFPLPPRLFLSLAMQGGHLFLHSLKDVKKEEFLGFVGAELHFTLDKASILEGAFSEASTIDGRSGFLWADLDIIPSILTFATRVGQVERASTGLAFHACPDLNAPGLLDVKVVAFAMVDFHRHTQIKVLFPGKTNTPTASRLTTRLEKRFGKLEMTEGPQIEIRAEDLARMLRNVAMHGRSTNRSAANGWRCMALFSQSRSCRLPNSLS